MTITESAVRAGPSINVAPVIASIVCACPFASIELSKISMEIKIERLFGVHWPASALACCLELDSYIGFSGFKDLE